MKTFSKLLIKECGIEPQNLNNGVMNHYIPIENIVINVRNLFAQYWGLVVEPGEDNQTLKIYNSQFTSEEAIFRILNFKPDGRTSLLSYVTMQGLPKVKLVNLGSVYVVYFYSTDIAGQEDPDSLAASSLPANQDCANPDNCICDKTCTDDMCSAGYTECEISDLSHFITESDEQTPLFYSGEIDLEDPTLRAIREITGELDKVKACDDFKKAIENNIQLPDGYYWKGVKDKDGLESIALRKKFMKRRPFGKEQECVKSLMNIYNNEEGGIWVEPFDHRDRLDREESQLLDSILAFMQAVPSDDPCVWSVKPDLGDDMNEALELGGHLWLVTDEFGQDIISVNTEEEANKVKEYWGKTNKVKCTVKKISKGIDFSKLSESLISESELSSIINEIRNFTWNVNPRSWRPSQHFTRDYNDYKEGIHNDTIDFLIKAMWSMPQDKLKTMFDYLLQSLTKDGENRGLTELPSGYFNYGYANESASKDVVTGVKDACAFFGDNRLYLVNKKLDTIVFCMGRGSNWVTSYIYVWKKGNLKRYSSPFVKASHDEKITFDKETIKGSTWGEVFKTYFDLTKFDFNKLLNDNDTFCIVRDCKISDKENYK